MTRAVVLFYVAALTSLVSSRPSPQESSSDTIAPKIKSVTVVANVTDPSLSRDGMVSARVGDRVFWHSGDTMSFDARADRPTGGMVSNTAGWSNLHHEDPAAGGPIIKAHGDQGAGSSGDNPVLQLYGENRENDALKQFYPVQPNQCPTNGDCHDGTRWAIWVSHAPLVIDPLCAFPTGYVWNNNLRLGNKNTPTESLNPKLPSYALYKIPFDRDHPDRDAFPEPILVDGEFWKEGEINFGRAGGVVNAKDGLAYLYGSTWNANDLKGNGLAVARVDPKHIEDLSQWEYFDNNAWTSQRTAGTSKTAALHNLPTSSGTIYWSDYFSAWVWIGQNACCSIKLQMSTAPDPWGPWAKAQDIYTGQDSDGDLPAYSVTAHPSMMKSAADKGIYVSYTQTWNSTTLSYVVTPLLYVEFE